MNHEVADEPRPPDVEAEAPAAAPSPLDQYTLEDSSYDPALDAPVEAATPPEEAKPLPARAKPRPAPAPEEGDLDLTLVRRAQAKATERRIFWEREESRLAERIAELGAAYRRLEPAPPR